MPFQIPGKLPEHTLDCGISLRMSPLNYFSPFIQLTLKCPQPCVNMVPASLSTFG